MLGHAKRHPEFRIQCMTHTHESNSTHLLTVTLNAMLLLLPKQFIRPTTPMISSDGGLNSTLQAAAAAICCCCCLACLPACLPASSAV